MEVEVGLALVGVYTDCNQGFWACFKGKLNQIEEAYFVQVLMRMAEF